MAKALSCLIAILAMIVLSAVAAGPAAAQAGPSAAPTSTIDVHALPPTGAPMHFDADKATNAYLARISGDARTKSDSYFEGGYVLLFVDALVAIAVSALLLFLRISSRMRKIAEGVTRSRFFQAPIYIALYLVLTTILTLPLTIYEGFFREHEYGLSNQNFGQWFGEYALSFAIGFVVFVILGTIVYAVIRRTRQYWWVWGNGHKPRLRYLRRHDRAGLSSRRYSTPTRRSRTARSSSTSCRWRARKAFR